MTTVSRSLRQDGLEESAISRADYCTGRVCKILRPHASAAIRKPGGHDELLFTDIGKGCERPSMRNAGRSCEGSRTEPVSRAALFVLLAGMQEEIRSQSGALHPVSHAPTPSSITIS